MRMNTYLNFFIVFCALTFSASCVSVKMNSEPLKKSETVTYEAPANQFVELESPHVDKSWQHQDTGSTISFLSECYNSVDPTLENIQKGIIGEISETTVLETHNVSYNSREGLHTTLEGKIDGVLTQFELMIFKKNNCTYILTYAADKNAFSKNQSDFVKFLHGFEAQ